MRRWSVLLAGPLAFGALGCAVPECVTQNFFDPECRVIAENERARLRSADGVEIRFQDPQIPSAESWFGLGLLDETGDGVVRARVAGFGGFAISIDPAQSEAGELLRIRLENVDSRTRVSVGGVPLPMPVSARLSRDLVVAGDQSSWVRGDTPCGPRYRIAVMSDVQTNPQQFERILARLHEEVEPAALAGEPLMGLVVPGDLTESSSDAEFERIAAVLDLSPVPVAVTPGNHDVYRPFRPHYNEVFGPGNYAFTICDTRVAMLDTGSGRLAASIEGRLPEFFDRRGARFLMVALHHPPYARFTGAGWSREDQAHVLLAEAARADVDLIVAGHFHGLADLAGIAVGDRRLREIIVGTAGAFQGLGTPRFGYVRVVIGEQIETCFVEVPPPGYAGPQGRPVSTQMPYCEN